MIHVIRGVWSLFFAVGLIMVGNGLQGSLLGLRATLEGFTTLETGLVMSAYYGGFLVASVMLPRLITDVGHIRVFAGFASIASTTVLLHALYPAPLVWLFMRFLTGFTLAGLYVVAESWLNSAASNVNRGRILALYMATTYACLAAGQYLLAFSDPASFRPFIVISILVSLALVPISLTRAVTPQLEVIERVGVRELYALSPLGLVACLMVGISQGGLLGMGAVYGKLIGLDTADIALLMSLPYVLVVVVLFPVGMISDRLDRRWLMVALNLLVAACALAAAAVGASHLGWLVVLFALYGGLSAPVYSIAVAHANDSLRQEKMLAASAQLVFVFGVGSIFGPLAAGLAMDLFGAPAFFVLGAAAHVAVVAYALYRMRMRPPVPAGERTGFVGVALRATPVAATAAIEDAARADEEARSAA